MTRQPRITHKLIRNRYGYFPSYWDAEQERYISYRKDGAYVWFPLDQYNQARIWLYDAKIADQQAEVI